MSDGCVPVHPSLLLLTACAPASACSDSMYRRQRVRRTRGDFSDNALGDRVKRLALRVCRIGDDEGLSLISGGANVAHQRNLAEQRHMKLCGHRCAATVTEQLGAVPATAANVIAHVFN